MFADALENFHITEEIVKWAKEALNQSHEIEKKEIEARLSRLRKQYTRNESYLHKIYQDLLDSKRGITEEFFRIEFNEKQKEQDDILSQMETLQNTNFSYMEEGKMILELMKDIKNTYMKADLRKKSKLLNVLLQRCILKEEETKFYWNKPFDLLCGVLKREEWGERGVSNPQPLDPQSSALTS
jgi:hypothetical protein